MSINDTKTRRSSRPAEKNAGRDDLRQQRLAQDKKRRKRRIIKRVNQHHMLLALLYLLVTVVIMIANFITPEKSFSDQENRVLAGRPALNFDSLVSGDFMTDYESYVADQFSWRNGWIRLKLNIERLLGKTESNDVYLGQDDYLIEKLSDPDVDSVNRNLDAITAFCERNPELSVHSVFIPNAAYICSDKLPFGAPVRSQEEDLNWLESGLPETAGFVDLSNTMLLHNTEDIYYRTDHHWTTLGAYYAFEALREPLGLEEDITWVPHTVTNDFQGTLSSNSGVSNVYDSIDIYEPQDIENNYVVSYDDTQEKTATVYDMEALDTKDKYTVFFSGNHSLISIETENQNERCLMVFKDSYANCFIPFLTPYYEKIIIIDPRYYYGDAQMTIRNEGITDVLFFYNVNTFMTDHSLADVLESGEEFQAEDLNQDTDASDTSGESSDTSGATSDTAGAESTADTSAQDETDTGSTEASENDSTETETEASDDTQESTSSEE